MTNQCNHGQLRRQCEVCDLTARLAEAERRSELESTQEAELDMVLPLKKTRPRGMQAIRDDRARRAIALIDDLRERLTDCNLAYMDARENYKVELARAIRDRDELRAEVARLTDCLKKANDSIEKYERLYYLEMDARETAEARLVALRSPTVTSLRLVDIDRRAVAAAQKNVEDPRASFEWADVRTLPTAGELNFIVSNPPFHDGGTEDRRLGQNFIRQASALLKTGGVLWLVANRHLPYEAELNAAFKRVKPVVDKGGYKIFEAVK